MKNGIQNIYDHFKKEHLVTLKSLKSVLKQQLDKFVLFSKEIEELITEDAENNHLVLAVSVKKCKVRLHKLKN